jgi:ankyrin repeat protein
VADSKDNTPLHYAAGYGRAAAVALLLDAGADVSIKNSTGKTAVDLAKLDERNPISQNADLLARMQV